MKNEKYKYDDNNTSWIEKYRITKIDDIIGQDHIIQLMKNIIINRDMPNLLLWGNPGVGKTSTSLSLCYELYGFKKFEQNVLELNASDERGISIVRNSIINFTKLTVTTNKNINFKIIILDEAESMTKDAQSALRKVMESYSNITRFIFICNNIHNIIEPIQSRCMKLKFNEIPHNNIKEKITEISISENLKLTKSGLKAIIELSNGDMRKCILLLQNLKYLDVKLNKKNIYNNYKYITFKKFNNYINKIKSTDDVLTISSKLNNKGYLFLSIINQYVKFVINMNKEDNVKSKILFELTDVENKIMCGCNEEILLWKLLNNIRINL
jgi:replication factor C subunit 2/4